MSQKLREQALAIYRAGLSAAEPKRILEEVDIPETLPGGRLLIFGAGKAAAHLGKALEEKLAGREYSGRIITKYDHGLPLKNLVVEEGGHPLPDLSGLRATEHILTDLAEIRKADRIIFLLTGGASSLLVAPAPGLSLSDKVSVTDRLLRSGATIQELNAVRKHLSAVKGGRLLERLEPANSVLSLIISDVIGDDLSAIGSGPMAADPTTYKDALDILEAYSLMEEVPPLVNNHLQRGATGDVAETPKPGSSVLDIAEHRILASNQNSLRAAEACAHSLGFKVNVFAYDMVGDVHECATSYAQMLLRLRGGPPCALLAGGELTLEVTGTGKGGRSQEFALVVARELAGCEGVEVLAAGTDGTDGPNDAAGAFANGESWEGGRLLGLEGSTFLANNDSHTFFDSQRALLKTGPTGTNVNDLVVGLTA